MEGWSDALVDARWSDASLSVGWSFYVVKVLFGFYSGWFFDICHNYCEVGVVLL